jgi:hypothetical protein
MFAVFLLSIMLATLGVTRYTRQEWARSSAVEHYIDIVVVTGSIPVVPTMFIKFRSVVIVE